MIGVGTHVWFQLRGKRTPGVVDKIDGKSLRVRYRETYYHQWEWRTPSELEAMT